MPGEEEKPVLHWELWRGTGDAAIDAGRCESADGRYLIAKSVLEGIIYWHFDAPELYKLKLRLMQDENCMDVSEMMFGFREFRVRGNQFFLNGEAVRLCGTEWMPGSNPDYGMAEPVEQVERMLVRLKESNCVFTRFHWQQDAAVSGSKQKQILCQQVKEMIGAHANHPFIIAWGVGNELDAQAAIAGTINFCLNDYRTQMGEDGMCAF